MSLDFLPSSLHQQIQQRLKSFDFKYLFIEVLNWNNPKSSTIIVMPSQHRYKVVPIAEKAGYVIYKCVLNTSDVALKMHKIRDAIEREVAKQVHEHIIIFTDQNKKQQIWQWVRRKAGRSTTRREEVFHKEQSGELLAQKLADLNFDLEEEERLTISKVTGRVNRTFDTEPVTKNFYMQFKVEQQNFFQSIQGIQDDSERRWYTTLMLSRLMLVYFIQRKGILDNDKNYLLTRLRTIQSERSETNFLSFYKDFLLRLFHEGLSKQQRTSDIEALLGHVPYLNGSLFEKRELEEVNSGIHIPDESFENILTFLNGYTWHLDARPQHNGDEINPDVLGYIFEQFVNEKENPRGAYYTKEDLTEYISTGTIIPCIFEAIQRKYSRPFEREGPIWSLLRDYPERYIYDSIKKGCERPLPLFVDIGTHDVSRRSKTWNTLAPDDINEYALPTETWREVVRRRAQCKKIQAELGTSRIPSFHDLIKYNLDIQQFAQDIIDNCEDTELLHTFYYTLAGRISISGERLEQGLSILDPACGSGAFLLAALNILLPLYQACLARMQIIISEYSLHDTNIQSQHIRDFQAIISQANEYPSLDFFILKSIIVNNLYGVDIMKEANEICKLRLFLKLMAYVDSYDHTKPLPSVDFNIYTGNTLVGFVDLQEVRELVTYRMASKLTSEETLRHIEEKVRDVEQDIKDFRVIQMDAVPHHDDVVLWKKHIHQALQGLRSELNYYLAAEYSIDSYNITNKEKRSEQFEQWQKSHQPFHWFIEFYGIIKGGGFDVIIGNPPYVEYSKVKRGYKILRYETETCGNIYAAFVERSLTLCHTQESYLGLVVPLSICGGERFDQLRKTVINNTSTLWLANFDIFPCRLFEGAYQRLTILLGKHGFSKNTTPEIYTTHIQRWYSPERTYLIEHIFYTQLHLHTKTVVFGKLASEQQRAIIQKMVNYAKGNIIATMATRRKTDFSVYYQEATNYWVKASCHIPYHKKNGLVIKPSHGRLLYFVEDVQAHVVSAIMNSTLFYLWFVTYSDGFHLAHTLVQDFPLNREICLDVVVLQLSHLLDNDTRKYATLSTRNTKTGDNIEIEEYRMAYSKPIIDEIDRVLAQHYGFTDEELDFIINYDIKYRMGRHNGDTNDDG